MKKLVLATLCGIASAQAFSAEASEDRMQFLESQLKQIQAELEQQKAAQLALKNQQEQAKAQDSKTHVSVSLYWPPSPSRSYPPTQVLHSLILNLQFYVLFLAWV